MHNKIQESCTGPEFAIGEVYGLRQWTVGRADWFAGPLRKIRLTGHFSMPWHLKDNTAICRASRSFSRRFMVSPHFPPQEYVERSMRRIPDPDLIDIVFEWAREIVEREGVRPEEVTRLELNGGRLGGTITAAANTFINDYFVTMRNRGEYRYDGAGRFLGPSTNKYRWEDFGGDTVQSNGIHDEVIHYDLSVHASTSCESVAQPSCTCGMYAYQSVRSLVANSYTNDSSVFGIIRGYGKVTIGTKGFRAEKADIVALAAPYSFYRPIPASIDPTWKLSTNTEKLRPVMAEVLDGTGVDFVHDPQELFDLARVQYGLK